MGDKTWINHIEWAVLMVTILGGFYAMDGKIEQQGARLDAKIEQQAARTDRLYEMYVDTQKEIAQLRIDWLTSKNS